MKDMRELLSIKNSDRTTDQKEMTPYSFGFLKDNGLIRTFYPEEYTDKELTKIMTVFEDIKPGDKFNFYDVFFDSGDIEIEEKFSRNFHVIDHIKHFAHIPSLRDFAEKKIVLPDDDGFVISDRSEFFYDNNIYLTTFSDIWIDFLNKQRKKYGKKYISRELFDYVNSNDFKRQIDEYVAEIREARKNIMNKIDFNEFVLELTKEEHEPGFDRLVFDPYRLRLTSPLKYLTSDFITKKFREFMSKKIERLNRLGVQVLEPPNPLEQPEVIECCAFIQKRLDDADKAISVKIENELAGRKKTLKQFISALYPTKGKKHKAPSENHFYGSKTFQDWFKIYEGLKTQLDKKDSQPVFRYGAVKNKKMELDEDKKLEQEAKKKVETLKKYGVKFEEYEGKVKYPWKSKIDKYAKMNPIKNEDIDFRHPDYKLNNKKLFRPSFSEYPNCWELDEVFNLIQPEDQWLFCINVNTRFLVVYRLYYARECDIIPSEQIMRCIEDLNKKYTVKSIRWDGDSRHLAVKKNVDNIMFYVNNSAFTYHNKLVDSVIRTIRDAIGYRYLQPEQLFEIIDYYNNTYHESIKMTPHEMQLGKKIQIVNPEDGSVKIQDFSQLELDYIRKMKMKRDKVLIAQRKEGLKKYQPGDILIIHLDFSKTGAKFEKQRRRFNRLAKFLKYEHGNVRCQLIGSREQLLLPIFYTRFVSKDLKTLPESIKTTFNLKSGTLKED